MKKLLQTLYLTAALIGVTPAHAFYTECTASHDIDLLNRPDGNHDPRSLTVEKGDKVGFRDSYKDWWFVVHWSDDMPDYGWVKRNDLTSCHAHEGTP